MLLNNLLNINVAEKSEESYKANIAIEELRERIDTIAKMNEEEKRNASDLTAKMTSEYNVLREELNGRAKKLEDTVNDLKKKLADADAQREKKLREKNRIIELKEKEIEDLKMKTDDMADEFATMLKVQI
jgi:uncharacterized phage infection (PIP) family protein YhgE